MFTFSGSKQAHPALAEHTLQY